MFVIEQIYESVRKGFTYGSKNSKTKEAIYKAFNSLLLKKRYSKITIQEIIDNANVGRSTFLFSF